MELITNFFVSLICCKTNLTKTILPTFNSKFKESNTSEKQIVSKIPVSSDKLKKQNLFPILDFLSLSSETKQIHLKNLFHRDFQC